MTTAQGWVLIGVLMAALSLVCTLVVNLMGSVRTELGAKIDGLREVMDIRFQGVDTRLDTLDRDVRAVIGRMYREGPPTL